MGGIEWMCNDVLSGDISANISIYSRLANILSLPAPTTHRRNDLFNNKVTSLYQPPTMFISLPLMWNGFRDVKCLFLVEMVFMAFYWLFHVHVCCCHRAFARRVLFYLAGWCGMVGWTTREDRCAFGRVYISPLLLLVYHRVGVFHVLRKFCAEKTGNCKTAINQQEHNIGARDPPSTFLQKRKMFHLWTGLTTDALIGLQPIVQSFCRTKSIEAFSDENSDLRISLVIVPHTKWVVWKARADLLVDCCDCHWISCRPVFMILLNWEELCVHCAATLRKLSVSSQGHDEPESVYE